MQNLYHKFELRIPSKIILNLVIRINECQFQSYMCSPFKKEYEIYRMPLLV